MRAKEASKAPDLVNDGKVFDIDSPDLDVFLSLPQWLQEKIQGNLDYEGSVLQEALSGHETGNSESEGVTTQKEKKAPQKATESVSEGSEEEDEVDW